MEARIRYRVTALKDLDIFADTSDDDIGESFDWLRFRQSLTAGMCRLKAGESLDDIAVVLRISPAPNVPEWKLIPHPRGAIGDRTEFHGLIVLERTV